MTFRTIDKFYPMFQDWAENGTEIDSSMRRIAFQAAMSKDPDGSFHIIKEAAIKMDSSDTKRDMLRALVATDNKENLEGLPALNMSADVGSQDIAMILFALSAHPVGRYAQWEFIKIAWEPIVDGIGDPGLLNHFLRIALEGFSTEAIALDVDEFFAGKDTAAFQSTLDSAKEQIRALATYRSRDSDALRKWLRDSKYI